MKNSIFIFISLLLSFSNLCGQSDSLSLKTPEGVCARMLDFISFEKDEVKDWDEFRNLFLPDAGAPISRQARSQNIEEFVRYWGPNYSKTGFEEYVIGVDVKEFNGIATVFQSFYCKSLDGSYEARGINTYQVVFLNDRWWIASSMFTNETEDLKLPEKFMHSKYKSNK